MTDFQIVVTILGVWVIGWIACWVLFADEYISAPGMVWWPIALIKYMLKSLYLVLFTGWKI